MKRALVPLLVLCSLSFSGCFIIPSAVEDERPLSTQYDDAGIKTSIAADLLEENATQANGVNVHCFEGQVFLIGEAEKSFRSFAVTTASLTVQRLSGRPPVSPVLDSRLRWRLLGSVLTEIPRLLIDRWGSGARRDRQRVFRHWRGVPARTLES